MTHRVVTVDAFKSVSVLFPGDLYNLACFLLKAFDAKAVGTNAKGRPTVHGLASSYTRLIIDLSLEQVEAMLQRHGFDLGATVEWQDGQAMP